MRVRFNVLIQTLDLGERLGVAGRLLEGSELIGVLLIGLVKHLSWVPTILLQGLHLHHCIVLLLNLLLLWAQHLLLRLLGEGGDSR